MSGKEDFLKIFTVSSASLSDFDKRVRELARDIKFLQDTAECVDEWVSVVPEESVNPQYWDYLSGAFRAVHESALSFKTFDPAVNSFSAISVGAGMTVNSVFHAIPVSANAEANIIERLDRLLDKDTLIPEVKPLFGTFGLDARAGSLRSPSELFDDAVDALKMPAAPDDSPASITLPLRHCIDDIIDRLLKRLGQQQRTRGRVAKISFIGQRSGKDGLPSDHFERLGFDAESLHSDLSQTKSGALPRHESIKLFERSALFIKALLGSIDEKKLRTS